MCKLCTPSWCDIGWSLCTMCALCANCRKYLGYLRCADHPDVQCVGFVQFVQRLRCALCRPSWCDRGRSPCWKSEVLRGLRMHWCDSYRWLKVSRGNLWSSRAHNTPRFATTPRCLTTPWYPTLPRCWKTQRPENTDDHFSLCHFSELCGLDKINLTLMIHQLRCYIYFRWPCHL